jgi:hypothetical protein
VSGRDAPAQLAAPAQPVFPIPDTRTVRSDTPRPAPAARGQPLAGRYVPRDEADAETDGPPSDDMSSAGRLGPVMFDTPPLAEGPSFDHATLSALCQEASEIGFQLSVAYATALTFRKAVRDYIPVDDDDITLCLDVGVIDILDAQHHRLATLQEHLTRAFYGPADGTSPRKSRSATDRRTRTERP